MAETDLTYMSMAVEQARLQMARYGVDEGGERPTPKVGCVVVTKAGKAVAGYRGEIEPNEHAEFTVLEKKMTNDVLAGATVFTTLEPCIDRNPPKKSCADRLIERRVSRVVIGYMDPDDRGRGYHRLREAGISVDLFPPDLVSEIEELNRRFIASRKEGKLNNGKHSANTPAPSSHKPSAETALSSTITAQLGRVLKLALVELDWRQKKLVDESKIPQPRLSRLMNGQAQPTDAEIANLMAVPELSRFLKANIGPITPNSSKTNTHETQQPVVHTEAISASRLTCGAWTKNGTGIVVAGFDGHVYLIDNGKEMQRIKVSNRVLRSLCFIERGAIVVVTDDDGNIFAAEFGQTPRHISIAHAGSAVYSCISIRDNSKVITADRNGDVVEWTYAKSPVANISSVGKLIKERVVHQHGAAAFGVAHLRSNDTCISVGADGMLLCTSKNPRDNRKVKLSSEALFSVATANDGKTIACSSAAGDIYLLEHENRTVLTGHTDTARCLNFSPAGKWLISGSKDCTVRLWNMESQNMSILSSVGDYIYTAQFSPDGQRALAVDGTGALHVINFPEQIDDLDERELEAWLSGNTR